MDATDGTTRSNSTRPRTGRGLTGYLAAIVAVPVLIVLLLSTELVLEQQSRSGRAGELVTELRHLAEITELRFSIARERSLVGTIDESTALGFGTTLVSLVLGTDVLHELEATAARSKAAVVAVQGEGQIAALYADIEVVRQDKLDRAFRLDADESSRRYRALEEAVRQRSDAELDRARNLANRVTGSNDLLTAISVLDASLRLHDASDAQAVELFNGLQAPTSEAAEASRVAMTLARGRFDLTMERLRDELSSGDSAPVKAFEAMQSSPSFQLTSTLLEERTSRPTKVVGSGFNEEVYAMAPLFRAMNEVARLDADLVAAATADAVARSLALGDRARRDGIISLGTAAFAVLVSAAIVLVVGRSIRRPLHRLEDQALHLLGGATEIEAVPEAGPREVRVVTRAVNAFADNLAQLERQAEALARADLADRSLAEPVTGVLGASLREAFGRLGTVMQEEASMRAQLAHDASHDALTGLLNRAAALQAVGAALARAERSGHRAAVLFVDLDGFKQVNDLYGHAVGDCVLQCAVQRLQAASRAGDTVARLGGDEFLLVAENIDNVAEVIALGERVVSTMAQPMLIDDLNISVGASVGVATGARAADVELVVADADLAVYQAKAAGKGQVELYHPGLRSELSRRSALESDLRAALHDGSLDLHFQPVTESDGRAVRSCEALLRWTRPGYGRVPPGDFIPVAEASALINDIGRWVLRRAAEQLAAWDTDPMLSRLRVAVNISARHLLTRGFVADVQGAMERARVSPTKLIIEVTETALLSDLELAAAHLQELRRLGVSVALDDFGTGHTSFTQLRRLPIDTIKIDRSYIATLANPAEGAMTRIMADIAKVLGVDVVAEGVERDDQLNALPDLGCGLAQGFLICPPLPAAEFVSWLHNRDHAPVATAANGVSSAGR